MTERKPVVIGIGGLLERGERGKVSDMLDIMASQYGCRTYEVNFADIRRDGNEIICSLAQSDEVSICRVLNSAKEDKEADIERIGIITSSMGAVPFMEYLSKDPAFIEQFRAYAANVPFTKLNPHVKKYLDGAISKGEPLDISSKFDKQRGVKRIIPVASLPYILSFDANEVLKEIKSEHRMSPLTILASKDERVDNESSVKLHYRLSGRDEDIVRFESDHCVPYELSRKPIIDFMVKSLDLKQSA